MGTSPARSPYGQTERNAKKFMWGIVWLVLLSAGAISAQYLWVTGELTRAGSFFYDFFGSMLGQIQYYYNKR